MWVLTNFSPLDDPRLVKPITVWTFHKSVPEILADVSKDTGVRLAADASVENLTVFAFASGQSASRFLFKLAECLEAEWRDGSPPTLQLTKVAKANVKAEAAAYEAARRKHLRLTMDRILAERRPHSERRKAELEILKELDQAQSQLGTYWREREHELQTARVQVSSLPALEVIQQIFRRAEPALLRREAVVATLADGLERTAQNGYSENTVANSLATVVWTRGESLWVGTRWAFSDGTSNTQRQPLNPDPLNFSYPVPLSATPVSDIPSGALELPTDDVLAAYARATRTSLIGEAPRPSSAKVESRDARTEIANYLKRTGDMLRFDQGWLTFFSPNRYTKRAETPRSLADPSLENISGLIRQSEARVKFHYDPERRLVYRLWGGLSAAQKANLSAGEPVPFDDLSPGSQNDFVRVLAESNRGLDILFGAPQKPLRLALYFTNVREPRVQYKVGQMFMLAERGAASNIDPLATAARDVMFETRTWYLGYSADQSVRITDQVIRPSP